MRMQAVFLSAVWMGLVVGAVAQTSVAVTMAPTPLLPAGFGEWKLGVAPAAAPVGSSCSNVAQSCESVGPALASSLSLAKVNKEALEECGPERSQVADYSKAGRTVHVEAIQFKDRTGAVSAFTLVRRRDMVANKELGNDAAVGDGSVLFTVGTSIVLVTPATAADVAGLKPLVGGLPKAMGNKGLPPLLPGLLPAAGLIEGSVRYALGAATYQAEGGILPTNSLGWSKEAEAVTAEYKDKRGAETLTVFLYPTPAIAGTYARVVQDLVGTMGPRSGASKVRREGELVMLANGSFAPDEAEKMIENIHLKQIVSFDQDVQPTPRQQIVQTYSLLFNIAVLAGVLMGAAVLLGLFLGGGRAMVRVMRGKPAASEPEFLSLHLNPQNKTAEFTKKGPGDGSG